MLLDWLGKQWVPLVGATDYHLTTFELAPSLGCDQWHPV